MINSLLAGLDTLLLLVFAAGALIGAVLMIVLREPMRVATALISTMVFLGGIYGLLGVHFIAAFQVLIYVGAVMVFMVYVIMLLDPRDPAIRNRFSTMLVPGVVGFVSWSSCWSARPGAARRRRRTAPPPRPSACSSSRWPSCASTGCISWWPRC
jgi:hypothetical protein